MEYQYTRTFTFVNRLVRKYILLYTHAMSMKVLQAAIDATSQADVARQLGISRQRLNNWLRFKKLPDGWAFGIAERLKVNGRRGAKANGT
jgi:DNA-binding transcriptional regulator YiaG